MKLLLILTLAVAPASAGGKAAPVPLDIGAAVVKNEPSAFSAKVLRFFLESRAKRFFREFNEALAKPDAEAAQKTLDEFARARPEIKEQEPLAFEYHQGAVNFIRGDFDGAYERFDKALKTLEEEYAKGALGGEYRENNLSFMGDLYFRRGAAELHRGKYANAVRDIDKGLAVSPEKRVYMHVNKCRALLRLNKFEEAAKAYGSAYRADPARAMSAEDRTAICETLKANGFLPQPCLAKN